MQIDDVTGRCDMIDTINSRTNHGNDIRANLEPEHCFDSRISSFVGHNVIRIPGEISNEIVFTISATFDFQ